jgi:hypothetical protein
MNTLNPIQKVLEILQLHGFDLNSAYALEMFGRKGDWHTKFYANQVNKLEVWEINPEFLPELRSNLPQAIIKTVDSFEEIKTTSSKYDLIVIDNPQSIYGEGRYCEHFELFPDVFRVCKDECAIILDVNIEPYNFHDGIEWWKRRKDFYNTNSPDKLSFDFVTEHYKKLCKINNFHIKCNSFVPRNAFMYYFVLYIFK